jgi:glycerophosphoryl diester phosphodiesterase
MNLINSITSILIYIFSCILFAQSNNKILLPQTGICAHRGASETHPENTLSAFKEAVRLGAHMIEFDVRMTKDKKLIIMHDRTVDRTTNGKGYVNKLTLEEIKKLDAGKWKSRKFIGEKVPTLKETLEMMPQNIWLNIHLKGDEELGNAVAKEIVEQGRVHQGVIACGTDAARGVRKVNSNIMICNMERQGNRKEYIEETIKGNFPFIQLLKKRNDDNLKNEITKLRKHSIKVNYYFGDTEQDVIDILEKGVNFVLTNKLKKMLEVAESVGIKRQFYRKKISILSKPKNGNIFVVAHRGAHIGIPENTLAAYQKAIDLGCDFIEIDIRKTKDGKFVSVHNATIDAYTEGKVKGNVSDFTLAQLKQINIGKRIAKQWENERIPTFEEILKLCKGKIGIYLDLKEPNVKELVDIARLYDMSKNIVWYIPASYIENIKQLKDYCPECIPMPDPRSKENINLVVKEVNPYVLATDMNELNEEYIKIAKKYNLKVIVDENEGTEEEWKKIIKWGTDGIQTDYPEQLINYLSNKENEKSDDK